MGEKRRIVARRISVFLNNAGHKIGDKIDGIDEIQNELVALDVGCGVFGNGRGAR